MSKMINIISGTPMPSARPSISGRSSSVFAPEIYIFMLYKYWEIDIPGACIDVKFVGKHTFPSYLLLPEIPLFHVSTSPILPPISKCQTHSKWQTDRSCVPIHCTRC